MFATRLLIVEFDQETNIPLQPFVQVYIKDKHNDLYSIWIKYDGSVEYILQVLPDSIFESNSKEEARSFVLLSMLSVNRDKTDVSTWYKDKMCLIEQKEYFE